jgi:microcin C transport system substrate-binding protein
MRLILSLFVSFPLWAAPQHGCSTFGSLKYPVNFTHFDYVNPNAPQGGDLRLGWPGTYNSLNPFIVRGDAETFSSFCIASLMNESWDEAGSSYAFGAQSVEVESDLSSVTFTLRPDLTFDNGTPITPEDIIFAFNALRDKGKPMFKLYYQAITKVEIKDAHTIVFHCPGNKSHEIGLVLGQIPLLSKTFFESRNFDEPLSIPMPCSGPYKPTNIKIGDSITYTRRENWWGDNVPSQKGLNNPQTIQVFYYRDNNAMFEAFKKGDLNLRFENISRLWATAYDMPPVKEGKIIKSSFKHKQPAPVQGFFFNTQRPIFADKRVRKALAQLYDFEWANSKLFYGLYKRSLSYFPNSQLEAKALPTPEELRILEPLKAHLGEDTFKEFSMPTNFNGEEERKIRENSLALLKEAGWVMKDQHLVHSQTGEPFTFEILIDNQSFERIVLHLKQCLERLPITVSIRLMDAVTFQERVEKREYDMIVAILPQSPNPGNELRSYWSSQSAKSPGTFNYSGVASTTIDKLVEELIDAKTLEEQTLRARCLDRALRAEYFIIHGWYNDTLNVAHWQHVHFPETVASIKPLPWALKSYWVDKTPTPKTSDTPQETTNGFLGGLYKRLQSLFA